MENNNKYLFLEKVKTKIVYQWELNYLKDWSLDELKNSIWTAKDNGQPIHGNVSLEALRMELIIRGETPNGYHEKPEDVDIKDIQIETDSIMSRKRRR